MADVIELHRGLPVRHVSSPRGVPPVEDAWMLPRAFFQVGMVVWADWWFAPLGLRVERNDVGRGQR